MKRRIVASIFGLIGLVFVLNAAASGNNQRPATASRIELASFQKHDVKVTAYLESDEHHQPRLAVLFEPLLAGYHLYSKDLPRRGVDGIGRPTLVELGPDSSLQARGSLVESVTTLADSSDKLSAPLLIYPEGPVTLRLPITIPDTGHPFMADSIFVTYMTCSASGQCTAPVVAQPIEVDLPALSNQ